MFHIPWLVVLGFLPQLAAFYLPATRRIMSDEIASASLVGSQIILLVFSFANFRLPGMPALAFGLACNLAVILANSGFMPLTLEAAAQLVNQSVLDSLVQGERISRASKDILLPESRIQLNWLADRFVPPAFVPYRFAFSVGDLFVAAGAFWMLVVRRRPIPELDSGVA